MSKIYARSLAGKEIVTMAGTVLGELENIILDPETGKLIDLLVKPDSELDPARYRKEGKLILGRGFHFRPGEKTLVVEDVTTTGGSVKKVIDIVEEYGGKPVGVGVLVDRTAGKIEYPVPAASVVQLQVESYLKEECPLCQEGVPLTDPDTRKAIDGAT